MNPNPTTNNDILICQFTFNTFDDRNVWYNVVSKNYKVTDKYGINPNELEFNIFKDKQEIVNYYKKFNCTVFFEEEKEKSYTYIPQINIVKY